MSKIQVNNEIILMRKNVIQARVQVIKKLTRSAMKLRQKKGTEAQKAKNNRKAERLAAEIISIKKLKKDEITKYILTNSLDLKEILENQNSEPLTRMMARIANHKAFNQKISEFKNKYPNYMEFLGPGRKKSAKLKNKNASSLQVDSEQKTNKFKNSKVSKETEENSNEDSNSEKTRESSNEDNSENENDDSENENDDSKNENDDSENENDDSENENDDSESEKEVNTEDETHFSNVIIEDKNDTENCTNTKLIKNTSPEKSKKKSKKSNELLSNKHEKKKIKIEKIAKAKSETKNLKEKHVPKIISKEAIVKRFTDILKNDSELIEDETNNSENVNSNDIKIDKKEQNNVTKEDTILKKRKKLEKDVGDDQNLDEKIHNKKIKSNIKIEKDIDSFFMTEDGATNHLSVVLPKSKLVDAEDDQDDHHYSKFNKQKFSYKQNDKYFNKIPKSGRGDSKFNSKWQDQHSDRKSYDKEPRYKAPTNRFNNEYNDRSNSYKNQSMNKFADNNNEYKDRSNSFKKQSKSSSVNSNNEVLHPSWQAKKKQQQILKQGFQGKKIVFGEDM